MERRDRPAWAAEPFPRIGSSVASGPALRWAPNMTNYLNASHGLASWLLTRDHKRIALLYLVTITVFFLIGGLMAVGIRLELVTPAGDFVTADTYNKMFTLHGVLMVFLFLLPSIPAVLGNFLIPPMIGAKDLAFPRINLLSWYLLVIGGAFTVYAMITGGVDTGWTFYTPYSTAASNTSVPPVTAERSPPDARMTGADSPVIADSSTDATPSIASPSTGMNSPASTS